MINIEIRPKSSPKVSQNEKNDKKAVKIDIFAVAEKVFSLGKKVHFHI